MGFKKRKKKQKTFACYCLAFFKAAKMSKKRTCSISSKHLIGRLKVYFLYIIFKYIQNYFFLSLHRFLYLNYLSILSDKKVIYLLDSFLSFNMTI